MYSRNQNRVTDEGEVAYVQPEQRASHENSFSSVCARDIGQGSTLRKRQVLTSIFAKMVPIRPIFGTDYIPDDSRPHKNLT